MWAEVLEVERVGIHDNFFEIGGHSLLAVQLPLRLLREMGLELPQRTIFETPTVAEMAARIEGAEPVDTDELVAAGPEDDSADAGTDRAGTDERSTVAVST
jgi:acyl carrier protein